MPGTLSPAESDFVEQLGLVAESAGLTRITGRIWALLIVSEEALAPAEIATLLQVSRASISVGLKTLESLELLHTRTRPGDRQSYFEMREQPYTAMMQLQGRRAAANLAMVRGALDRITKPSARKGLQDLEFFYATVLEGHAGMLAKLEGRSS
jgi:DNA-binding transcriptional regulator GbsR (MarR family)